MHPPPHGIELQTLSANLRLIWAVIAAMTILLCPAYWMAGLSLDLLSGDFMLPLIPACAFLAWFYRARRPDPWISYGAEAVAQTLAILIAGTLTTYAAAKIAFPYRDAQLQAFDQALGLNWRAYLDFANAHPWFGYVSHAVYFSMKPQTALIIGALTVSGRFHRLQQFVLALAATMLITIATFIFAPAVGAFAHLGLVPSDTPNFVPAITYQEMAQLDGVRSGALHVIRFNALEGLISFPSFHTAAGVLASWALWPSRRLRWWVLALNAAMIAVVPIEGAHYFVDLPAGAAVAAAGIWIGTRLPARAARLPLAVRADAAVTVSR